MGTTGKQRLTGPPTKSAGAAGKTEPRATTKSSVAKEAPVPARSPEASPGVMSAAKETIKDAIFEKRPYLKYAFANPYNLALLLGAIAASAITLNPLIAVAALGLEGLWLLHAPDSKLLRRLLWDPKFEKLRLAIEQQARAERIKTLREDERERVERLVARQQEIHRLASQNPSFTGELLRGELIKTGRLVDSFIEMALTCARYEEYLESVDIAELERERRRWDAQVKASESEGLQTEIAKKNLAIILKRIEKVKEIRNYLSIARGQLDLIENSFQLIADQIVTMQSPQELSGQLDELLDGVESIKQTAVDTEKLLATL